MASEGISLEPAEMYCQQILVQYSTLNDSYEEDAPETGGGGGGTSFAEP